MGINELLIIYNANIKAIELHITQNSDIQI